MKKGWSIGVILGLCYMMLPFTLFITQAESASNTFLSGTYTSEEGTRNYKLFIPSGYKGQRVPLYVMLHGCTQNPDDFAAGTEMNQWAEEKTFLVLYPAQSDSANANLCWNWFEPAHQKRDSGEPAIIKGMTAQIMKEYNVEANQVYAAGMSAGGAMTAILGAAYPDVYAAIGVSAGLEYRAAHDLLSAVSAQELGGPNPDDQGGLAYLAAGEAARVVPTIVFHGANDLTVQVVNGHQVLSQWAQANDYADDGLDNATTTDQPAQVTTGQVPDGYSYTRSVYTNIKGVALMEKWIVDTMTHRWSGGSPNGSYTDPKGPSATGEMVRFFGEHPKNK
jgi:poly(hydroxyalkanoate) depolymerase family esterase